MCGETVIGVSARRHVLVYVKAIPHISRPPLANGH
jgi:hypothetical protein